MNKVIRNATTTIEKILDKETGELVVSREEENISTKTVRPTEPPYFKVYIKDILYLKDMPTTYTNLVYALLERTTYANYGKDKGLCVFLNTYLKQEILNECGYTKMHSLDNALSKLAKRNIIKRLGSGTYQFNPYLFGRGEWKDIKKIRMTWDYDANEGCTFSTVITRETTEEEQ